MAYVPKMNLRDYQLEALSLMEGKPAFALLMAMRTGKSATLLADFGRKELDGDCDHLVVVAPAGVYKTWEGQVRDHLSEDLQERVQVYVWESGKSKHDRALD